MDGLVIWMALARGDGRVSPMIAKGGRGWGITPAAAHAPGRASCPRLAREGMRRDAALEGRRIDC